MSTLYVYILLISLNEQIKVLFMCWLGVNHRHQNKNKCIVIYNLFSDSVEIC